MRPIRWLLVGAIVLVLLGPAGLREAAPSPVQVGEAAGPPPAVARFDWQIEVVDTGDPPGGDVGLYTSLALEILPGGQAQPYISYYDLANADLKYAYRDSGRLDQGWQVETVDAGDPPDGEVGLYTSLALDGEGNPHISYYDATNADLKYARYDGATWISRTVDSLGWVGEHTSLALDDLGDPHVSYFRALGGDLKYAHRGGAGWETTLVDRSGRVGWFTSLALDAVARPHIGYYDAGLGNLRYASFDGTTWVSETVDAGDPPDTTWVGLYSSLALDGEGNPHISYYNETDGDLYYAFHDGITWQIEVVDKAGQVGTYTALALDAQGHPYISYYDEGNRDLKLAFKGEDGWQVATVDAGGDVGSYTSLALDAYGRVHIAYYDATNGNLKYAWGCEPVREGEVSWTPLLPREGEEVTFTAEVSGTPPLAITWSLGGVPAVGPVVTRTFATAGFYDVVMTATNCAGAGAVVVSHKVAVTPISSTVRYVGPDGIDVGDCSNPVDYCRSIGYALERAFWTDEIRVAEGVYQDVGPVIYLTKWVTLTGGWRSIDFGERDPARYPTVLDAQRGGAVIVVSGTVRPAVDGFMITRGSGDRGGAICGDGGGLILRNSVISDSVAVYGGGVGLTNPVYGVVLEGNRFLSNTASGGGAVYVAASDGDPPAWFVNNEFWNNRSEGDGGGLFLDGGSYVLSANTFLSNTAGTNGGGLILSGTHGSTIGAGWFQGNTAQMGAGLYLDESNSVIVADNVISANHAISAGGGIYVHRSPTYLDTNVFQGNEATSGDGLALWDTAGFTLSNNTVWQNGDGILVEQASIGSLVNNTLFGGLIAPQGMAVQAFGGSDLRLTNNILTRYTTAISATAGSTVTARYNLFFDNLADTGGEGTFYNQSPIEGNPRFWDPSLGDLHLRSNSAAINAGYPGDFSPQPPVDDFDGEPRPQGALVDVGADERVVLYDLTAANDGPTVLGEATTLSATVTVEDDLLATWGATWAFGDGDTAKGFVVEHVYPAVGVYTAVVTASSHLDQLAMETLVTVTSRRWDFYLPLAAKIYSTCFLGPEEEPNNASDDANGPLCPHRVYQGYPNDSSDYFYLLSTAGTISATMENYTGKNGQFLIYDEELNLLDRDYDPQDGWHVSAEVTEAGLYYIRIYTEDEFNEDTPYSFWVDFTMP